MIYQCYECRNLFDEDDGAMGPIAKMNALPVPFNQILMVFKCKDCIGEEGRKLIEELQKEKREKGKEKEKGEKKNKRK